MWVMGPFPSTVVGNTLDSRCPSLGVPIGYPDHDAYGLARGPYLEDMERVSSHRVLVLLIDVSSADDHSVSSLSGKNT